MTFIDKTVTINSIPYILIRFLLEDCGIKIETEYIYTQTYPTFFLHLFSTLKLPIIQHKIETKYGIIIIEQRDGLLKLITNTIEQY